MPEMEAVSQGSL